MPKTQAILRFQKQDAASLCETPAAGGVASKSSFRRFGYLKRTSRAAFTLIEILSALAIVAVLAALLMPSMLKSIEKTRRMKCASNMRQQYLGMIGYAEDNNGEAYWANPSVAGDNAPASLYPDYVSDLNLFICPSTKNRIRVTKGLVNGKVAVIPIAADLQNNAAGGRLDDKGGHSYEYWADIDREPLPPYTTKYEGGKFKSPKWVASTGLAASIVLIVDGDDTGTNNFPDETNNHGSDGWNWCFADGHVEWVTQKQTKQRMKEAGQD